MLVDAFWVTNQPRCQWRRGYITCFWLCGLRASHSPPRTPWLITLCNKLFKPNFVIIKSSTMLYQTILWVKTGLEGLYHERMSIASPPHIIIIIIIHSFLCQSFLVLYQPTGPMSHRKFEAPRHGSLGFLVSCVACQGETGWEEADGGGLQSFVSLRSYFSTAFAPPYMLCLCLTAQEEDKEAPWKDSFIPQGKLWLLYLMKGMDGG